MTMGSIETQAAALTEAILEMDGIEITYHSSSGDDTITAICGAVETEYLDEDGRVRRTKNRVVVIATDATLGVALPVVKTDAVTIDGVKWRVEGLENAGGGMIDLRCVAWEDVAIRGENYRK